VPFCAVSAAALKGLREGVPECLGDGQTLDPLCAPLRRDLGTGNAPDLFRVVLEEGPIELSPKRLTRKVLEGYLGGAGRNAGPDVAAPTAVM